MANIFLFISKLNVLAVLVLIFFSQNIYSQNSLKLKRATSEIILDGIINEKAWDDVEPFPLTQYEPVFKGEMSERTDIRVTYDSEFLYVAGKMYTNDPSTITANSLYRDRYSGDDVFAIILDPFNDNQNALRFFTTPAGVRFDQAISNDANSIAGSNAVNSSWNTYWDVATTQDENGWYAEMRIPFSSIGFQDNNGIAEMGLIVYRWLSHHNERHIFPAIPPNWSQGNTKPSQAQDVIIEGVDSKKPIYFTPYLLTGYTGINELNADNSAYNLNDSKELELGFDLKYNVTSNLTLDLTANTDFAQVEADDQQLNLSRFSISFPEKRQFFQQRAGLFDFNFGHTNVFYSRRIGLDATGNPVRILGGARLTGRIDDLDIGVINLQTAASGGFSSENFGILRVKKNVLNPQSFLGGIYTSRIGADGSTNLVLGADGDFNIFGDDFIQLRVSQSYDDAVTKENRLDFVDNSIFRITWQRRASLGLFYRFFVNRTGKEFRPDIGFFKTVNTSDYFYNLGYGWLADENSIIKNNTFEISSFNIHENETFNIRSRFISSEWQTEFKTIGQFRAQIRFNQEYLLMGEDFNLLGQIYIPVDDYDFYEGSFSYETNNSRDFSVETAIEFGQIFDGSRIQLEIKPKYVASIHFEFSGGYQITKLDFDNRLGRTTTDFTAHLARFRLRYALNKKFSSSAFIQYGNVAETAAANIRFRYNFSEGRDLWLVVNEQQNTDLTPDRFGFPEKNRLLSRSILLKYNHTFSY